MNARGSARPIGRWVTNRYIALCGIWHSISQNENGGLIKAERRLVKSSTSGVHVANSAFNSKEIRKTQTAAVLAVVLTLIASCGVAAAAPTPPTETIYGQSGIATVTTGYDLRGLGEIRHRLAVVVSGPTVASDLTPPLQACAARALSEPISRLNSEVTALTREIDPTVEELQALLQDNANRLHLALDQQAKRTSLIKSLRDALALAEPSTPEEYAFVARWEFGELSRMFAETAHSVSATLAGCARDANLKVGIALYACLQMSGPCASPRNALEGSSTARRFGVVYEWLSANDLAKHPRGFPSNAFVAITSVAPKVATTTAPTETTKLGLVIGGLDGVLDTAALIDPAESQRQFERLAMSLRANGAIKMARSVPRVLDLPQEIVIRVADVIQDPTSSFDFLRKQPTATFLSGISDEVARTRILECVRYKGQFSAVGVAKCSAYTLDDKQLFQCMNGQECNPVINVDSLALPSTMLLSKPMSVTELAKNQLLPRKLDLDSVLPGIAANFKVCASQNKLTGEALRNCALAAGLGEQLKQAACIKKPSSFADANEQLKCAFPTMPTQLRDGLNAGKCMGDKGEKAAACLIDAVGAGEPKIATALACQREAKDPVECTFKALGGKDAELAVCVNSNKGAENVALCIGGKDAASVLCVKSANNDVNRIALCLAQTGLPKQVTAAIACAQNNASSYGGMALCLGADKAIPEKLRKPAQCLASSGGDPFGATVCMASDGLTDSQRIALQCAAQTGGEPTSWATCTGGQMLMSTLISCSKDDFGEGGCFGPNNEFQRFANFLTGRTISKSSVVGMYIDFYIKAGVASLDGAKAVGKGIEHLSHEIQQEAKRFDRFRRTAQEDVGNAVFTKPINWVGRNVRQLFR